MGAAAGGILAFPVGVVVGLAVKHDAWGPTSIVPQSGVRISVRPVLGKGVGVGASVAFQHEHWPDQPVVTILVIIL